MHTNWNLSPKWVKLSAKPFWLLTNIHKSMCCWCEIQKYALKHVCVCIHFVALFFSNEMTDSIQRNAKFLRTKPHSAYSKSPNKQICYINKHNWMRRRFFAHSNRIVWTHRINGETALLLTLILSTWIWLVNQRFSVELYESCCLIQLAWVWKYTIYFAGILPM